MARKDKRIQWENIILIPLLVATLTLSACSNVETGEENEDQTAEDVENSEEDSVVFNSSDHYYRPLIRDGSYQSSQSRGVTQRLNSTVNLKSFESGLMKMANDHFSTDTHFFEEGQYISSETIEAWLGRQSSDNAQGLNPPRAENGEDYVPIYLESILEQDFYVEGQDGMQLDGIMIGLAMNSIDYYQEVEFGPTLSQEIPREDIVAQSKEMIKKILSQLRELEELRNIPIVFGVFEQASSDDLGGGTYIAKVVSESGTDLGEFQEIKQEKLVLPLEGENTTLGGQFANFRVDVEKFFPNTSGLTAVAHFEEDQLMSLKVDINTQFFGEGEMIAFSQYVEAAAMNFLPTNVPVEITIQSIDAVEAFLYTDGQSGHYFSHIFD